MALTLALEGRPLVLSKRMPLSPFVDQELEVVKEQDTLDWVRPYVELKSDDLREGDAAAS
jgi:hypothetical protein